MLLSKCLQERTTILFRIKGLELNLSHYLTSALSLNFLALIFFHLLKKKKEMGLITVILAV